LNISVIGSGRWGSFLAWYLNQIGHKVCLYGRKSENTIQFFSQRKNEFLTLNKNIDLTYNLEDALKQELIVISVPSQSLRQVLCQIAEIKASGKLFVLCMKGLELNTGKRLSQVAAEEIGPKNRVAVWLGPGHVQEFVKNVPNCMVIDAESDADKHSLINTFTSGLIRFYIGQDLIGNEIGAAAKNVVGVAAGMLDGFGLTSLKGALMSRACREYARLIVALGGSELSAYGLCHLGDYEATVFSQHSNNRMFGEKLAKNQPFEKLAEGCHTVKALMVLSEKTGIELPISQAVYSIIYDKREPKHALDELFNRSLKEEFW
jgi:glycerol-3-phosphate dehydrogenase (NAD(P)+)